MYKKDVFSRMSDFSDSANETNMDIMKCTIENIKRCKHTILVGPPGTGKTRLVKNIIDMMKERDEIGEEITIQFHPQYSYQDFIEGYTVKEGVFDYKTGVFKKFVENCSSEKINIFVIDEINRADISSVFGELLILLDYEEGKSVVLPGSGQSISLPEKLVILGTMNSADKNIAIMDFALRRRFSFIFVPPDYDGFSEWLSLHGIDSDRFGMDEYVRAARSLNNRIILHPLLGKNMTLGQSFFIPSKNGNTPFTEKDIAQQFSQVVIPQIEMYLGHGRSNDLSEITSPLISQKVKTGQNISTDDVIDLILALSGSRECQDEK